ncbi:MAG: hypothetical protein QOF18_1833 [Frankiaceae bacterium]|jgi:hypothetical protein|nr:hypothetical protein [Frankiaceae bacterium]
MSTTLSTSTARRAAAFATLALAASAGIALAGHASAAGCAATDYSEDGHVLTAAIVAAPGQVVSGPQDATGCDIGVYFGPGIDGSVNGAVIGATELQAPTYYGVLVNGAAVDVTNSSISNVGNHPHDGTQHGIGVDYLNVPAASVASGTVMGDSITAYQKGGIAVEGNRANVSVLGNTVTGLGPVPFIAQNGVQYSDGAVGSIVGNDINDNYYTGCSNKDAAKTGCIPYVSTGLLLYNIDPSSVKASNNHFRGDQRNQYMAPAKG